MKNKRGVSGVVVTILIIFLTVVAAVIISSFIIPFVKNSLTDSTICLDKAQYIKFKENFEYDGIKKYNCRDNSDQYGIALETSSINNNSANNEVSGIRLVFYDGEGNSEVINIEKNQKSSCEIGKLRNLGEECPTNEKLNYPENNEISIYVYNAGKYFEYVEVYPKVNEKICQMNDKIEFISCREGVDLNVIE